ncbi:S46 family peptidase [Aureibacter tunicatorum]|uniref:Dipeptidyl-peptidase n=1 Tax=Aureibacter tunicatorum TaxID=866807 RepID=A0AAE3XK00_9BACT|nr:S46 family peptidase [Aureibacter tunicatorum]MDR6238307.1 hypothetical protein [Aureibacter tunicatorum]BDD03339.1 hypothetical protein AUTU_08220 [Aureibacter tunicatorum]
MIKKILTLFMLAMVSFSSFADEGMWLPIHVERLYNKDLKKLGLKLSPEEIYSVNHSSLKDAIVSLGGFCTGEIISEEGLMLTNHHCAFGSIQHHSSVEHDYLTDGFWAKSKSDELPNEGLYARFLVRMENVTHKILDKVNNQMSEDERAGIISEEMKKLTDEATEGTHYDAQVKPFLEGNEYYLFVYETYNDVRLVGAPPSSIGKFGGDTDNWQWPRHTGDFSLFRVYMSPDGKPAEYSPDNIPLKPKHHLPISLKGVHEGDFAMIMGFPGSTDRYLSSYGIQLALDVSNKTMIEILQTELETWKKHMNADPEVRIKYASKYASLSNYWKYLIGQTKGLKRLNVHQKKEHLEKDFRNWYNAKPSREAEYGQTLEDIKVAYDTLRKYQVPFSFARFMPRLMGIVGNASQYKGLNDMLNKDSIDNQAIAAVCKELKVEAMEYFKNYDAKTDEAAFVNLAELYSRRVKPEYTPDFFVAVKEEWPEKKNRKDFEKLGKEIYANSIFCSEEKLQKFLDNPEKGVISGDPAFIVFEELLSTVMKLAPSYQMTTATLEKSNRVFLKGLMEMNPEKDFYSNANSTMRFTYGTVGSYDPADAIHYDYITTLKGVIEKEDASNPEFVVPPKLKELYEKKDYGIYADKNGTMPIAFLSNNDITGGNSGSPVINGDGELIGTAFDGNWEAMSGDIAFEPELQRTISVDIRYTLFIIDKFAGAGYLIDEMTLVTADSHEKESKNGKKKKKKKHKK